jgi:hypothetical protein
MTTADQLAARAMALAAGACDDDLAVAELCRLAVGNDHALDQAILACLAQPASLTARRLAIELARPRPLRATRRQTAVPAASGGPDPG